MKGVEAPFQLMVSVIALLMVLALAYMVLSNAMKEDCGAKWQNELRAFASSLATAVQGSAPTKLAFRYDFRCGSATEYNLYIDQTTNATRCLRICGTSSPGGCTIVRLKATRMAGGKVEVVGDVPVCVEGVSSYVNWGKSESCGDDGTNVTYELTSKGMKLQPPFGVFIIKKLLTTGEPVVICRRG